MNEHVNKIQTVEPTTLHDLHGATKAAEILKAHLIDLGADDDETLRDTLEGECNLTDLIEGALEQIALDGAALEGIAAHKQRLQSRESRLKKRIDNFRTALQTALDVAVLKTHEGAIGTITRKRISPSLVITSESDLPSEYFIPQEPKLDRKALTDALKDKQIVPGAELSNGGETIQIRWK